MTTKLERFTWGEYLASARTARLSSRHVAAEWTDYETFDSALGKMANGDDAYAPMADKLLDEIMDLAEGSPVREWTPGVMGAYAVIPEAIMGFPQSMRALSPAGELSPVKIVVSTTCSAGIDREIMTRRGVAILALLMKLQAVRPVELSILVEGEMNGRGNLFQLITVDTKPLSIAHACFALANAGFARQLTYSQMRRYHDWRGKFPEAHNTPGYDALVREHCEMTPEDLWIRAAHLSDPMIDNPVAWVNRELARFSGDVVSPR